MVAAKVGTHSFFSASLLMVFSAVFPSMDFSPMKSDTGTFETNLQIGK